MKESEWEMRRGGGEGGEDGGGRDKRRRRIFEDIQRGAEGILLSDKNISLTRYSMFESKTCFRFSASAAGAAVGIPLSLAAVCLALFASRTAFRPFIERWWRDNVKPKKNG